MRFFFLPAQCLADSKSFTKLALIMTMFIIITIVVVAPVWKGGTVYPGAYVVSSYDTTQSPLTHEAQGERLLTLNL